MVIGFVVFLDLGCVFCVWVVVGLFVFVFGDWIVCVFVFVFFIIGLGSLR